MEFAILSKTLFKMFKITSEWIYCGIETNWPKRTHCHYDCYVGFYDIVISTTDQLRRHFPQ